MAANIHQTPVNVTTPLQYFLYATMKTVQALMSDSQTNDCYELVIIHKVSQSQTCL